MAWTEEALSPYHICRHAVAPSLSDFNTETESDNYTSNGAIEEVGPSWSSLQSL